MGGKPARRPGASIGMKSNEIRPEQPPTGIGREAPSEQPPHEWKVWRSRFNRQRRLSAANSNRQLGNKRLGLGDSEGQYIPRQGQVGPYPGGWGGVCNGAYRGGVEWAPLRCKCGNVNRKCNVQMCVCVAVHIVVHRSLHGTMYRQRFTGMRPMNKAAAPP